MANIISPRRPSILLRLMNSKLEDEYTEMPAGPSASPGAALTKTFIKHIHKNTDPTPEYHNPLECFR